MHWTASFLGIHLAQVLLILFVKGRILVTLLQTISLGSLHHAVFEGRDRVVIICAILECIVKFR